MERGHEEDRDSKDRIGVHGGWSRILRGGRLDDPCLGAEGTEPVVPSDPHCLLRQYGSSSGGREEELQGLGTGDWKWLREGGRWPLGLPGEGSRA